MENSTVKSEIVDAFHLMWDNYASVVMLLSKERSIIAVNSMGAKMGISPGPTCYSLNRLDHVCPGCKANGALKERTAQRKVAYSDSHKRVVDTYWIPLSGNDTYYVHFGNDISEYAKRELFPEDPK